jgi:energy-coupling factor transporter transmembrane protein EcfT
MNQTLIRKAIARPRPSSLHLGTRGYFLLFGWSMVMAMLASGERLGVIALLSAGIAVLVYPGAFRRLLHWRWLLFLGFLLIPNLLWGGPRDSQWLGVAISTEGLQNGVQMVLRALVVMLAVDGFASSVSVSEMAGLLERVGLKGLGFALGVSINLLPILRESFIHTRHSLWLRGGFRQQRLRALRLFLVTVITNAVQRAEEISLAAEARAFSPERTRPLPLKPGRADPILAVLLLVVTVLVIWG